MLVCLAYLCSRLMESSKEIFACILIQDYYRRYRHRVVREKKAMAATVIFYHWRNLKGRYFNAQRTKYAKPVQIIERFILQRWASLLKARTHRLAYEMLVHAATLVQVRQLLCYFVTDI